MENGEREELENKIIDFFNGKINQKLDINS